MSEDSEDSDVFTEYKPLRPKRRSLQGNIVLFLHLLAAIVLSVTQFASGLDVWFYGLGVATPILLIINGFAYSFFENDSWYKEEMVPYLSRIVSTTEIETDKYRQFHRRTARLMLIFGWVDIILCQLIWTWGLTVFLRSLLGEDLLTMIIRELFAYIVLFGPFFLYFIILLAFGSLIDKLFLSGYDDIKHLLELENKWNRENQRRAKMKEMPNEPLVGNGTETESSLANANP